MPIAALIANDRVLGPVMDESARIGTLGHGYTAGGHPVATAVSLECLRIIEEDGLVANCAAQGERMRTGLAALSNHPLVGEVRGVGMIAAIELVTDKTAKVALDVPGKLGGLVNKALQDNGVICRAVVDAICFCPPMIITASQIDDLLAAVSASLDRVAADLGL